MSRPYVLAMVFLDTSVLKHTAQTLVRGFVRPSTAKWGDQDVTFQVTQFREINTHERIDENLRRHTILLPLIAQLAKRGRIVLVTHTEVME